ncbi:hypothetical protein MMC11_003852 [Xylographa trunciseda]|nr:hypothetical protein [Xylographa trunciseda]
MYFQRDSNKPGTSSERDREWGSINANVQTQSSPSSSGSESGSIAASNASTTNLPSSVREFFAGVSSDGYPQHKAKGATARSQPWKKVWEGPQKPSEDGKLLVACPKRCDFGIDPTGYDKCNTLTAQKVVMASGVTRRLSGLYQPRSMAQWLEGSSVMLL